MRLRIAPTKPVFTSLSMRVHNECKSMEMIESALQEAARYLAELPAPNNEANTCDWIIRPLLRALGYENYEIHSQTGDAGNRFPDYTILPDSDHTWYLEAKSWSTALESIHVDQALNYAHSNGKRWVVLSNGREWRLYDDHITGRSADRHVATAMLEDHVSMMKFLEALSKPSILAQHVAVYAEERRIREYLSAALTDPNSDVVRAILKVVSAKLGSPRVTPQSIVDIIHGHSAVQGSLEAQGPPSIPDRRHLDESSPAPSKSIVFYCRESGANATGVFNGTGIVILKGSILRKDVVPSARHQISRLREKLLAEGTLAVQNDRLVATCDISTTSPSNAAELVLGRASNGWIRWIAGDGRTLEDHFPRSDKAKWRIGVPWNR